LPMAASTRSSISVRSSSERDSSPTETASTATSPFMGMANADGGGHHHTVDA
jgi:hypothetical protein